MPTDPMPTDPRRSDPSRIAAPGAAPAHRFVVTGVRSRTHLVHIAAYLRRELASRDGELQVRYVEGGRFLGHAQVTRDDVHRLLAELTDQPVRMLGCNLGAVIGLHVAVRHPDQIGTLVAHEPVAPRLLPDDRRGRHERELAEVQALYEREGLTAAFKAIADVLATMKNGKANPRLAVYYLLAEKFNKLDVFK